MKPVLIDFPERIETERLYFRPCLPGDGAVVQESITASRESLSEWLPFAVKEQSASEVEAGIRQSHADFILRTDFRMHIFRKEDEMFIGSIGLHRVNWDVRKFEIGYWCDTRQSKKGYITEAVEKLTDFTFTHLQANRVEIRCDTMNLNSRHIPERLGFTLEGILRSDSLGTDGNTLRDTCVFAKIKGE
ncbi:GNAT family N-acetyltransferase [Cytobacillus purgationiresistens]|uniref:RimJ/RimL family protein N-acetyltransferase n=1 Tax=Cytobacillus purgationiresistens TaxID=863449 RepID=A0ABU0ADJ8_9BACI|nr:GNAT family N-acetyltransferase [Cytobacillus purgationiresistens]MDQ0269318.1 RimJ/RimL family protein N-acetyltransferase [Cytobacillus purgationiresistens]